MCCIWCINLIVHKPWYNHIYLYMYRKLDMYITTTSCEVNWNLSSSKAASRIATKHCCSNEHTTLIAEKSCLWGMYFFKKKRPVNHEERSINIVNPVSWISSTHFSEGKAPRCLGETSHIRDPGKFGGWIGWSWVRSPFCCCDLSMCWTLENLLCFFIDKCQYIIHHSGINSALEYPSKEGRPFWGAWKFLRDRWHWGVHPCIPTITNNTKLPKGLQHPFLHQGLQWHIAIAFWRMAFCTKDAMQTSCCLITAGWFWWIKSNLSKFTWISMETVQTKNNETHLWTWLVIERNGVDKNGDVPSRIWASLMNNEV